MNDDYQVNSYLKRSGLNLARERGAKYGPLRNNISLKIRDFFGEHPEYHWFLAGGTLLAAYRDGGKMIPHDDDIDLGIIFEDYYNALLNQADQAPVNSEQINDARKLELHHQLKEFLKGGPYDCRMIKLDLANLGLDYAEKIEVFDPTYGHKPIRDTNYYHVALDIQIFTNFPTSDEVKDTQVTSLHCNEGHMRCPLSAILPVSQLKFEGEWYNTPGDPKAYLESAYGYLGRDAKFNLVKNLYEKL